MPMPHPTAGRMAEPRIPHAISQIGKRKEAPQRRSTLMMRRYHATYLTETGDIETLEQVAPALPLFEDAFCAFARGTLVTTEFGSTAVEDLMPGDRIQTLDNGMQTLLWVGSMSLIPNAKGQSKRMTRLTRFSADSLGFGRPSPDLLLGPAANLFQKNSRLPEACGSDKAVLPASGFTDGESVISVCPATPVQVFHLAFKNHQIIRVNGLECESYHPGLTAEMRLSGDMLRLFLSLFPQVNSLDDFGPVSYPRLSREDMEQFHAA